MTARKPRELKLVEGTERPDRQVPRQPRSKPNAKAPRVPSWLDRYGQAKWRELIPELVSRQLLTGPALSLLELLCEAWADFRRSQAVVRKSGGSYAAATEAKAVMHRRRPEVEQARHARKEYAGLLSQFSTLIAGVEPVEERDPMDSYLERGRRGRRSTTG